MTVLANTKLQNNISLKLKIFYILYLNLVLRTILEFNIMGVKVRIKFRS